jgi:energy-coupling factor transport system substrate-specific component
VTGRILLNPWRLSPRWRIGIGAIIVAITYGGLISAKPDSVHGGVGGPAALLALCGYTLGAMLIVSGAVAGLPTTTVALLPVAITINIVMGKIVYFSGLPLQLDSIGTVLVGVLAGPAAGAATGALASIVVGMTITPGALPYAVTAALIGFIAGTLARAGWFRRLPTALLAGGVIGVAAGIVSAPITAFVFGNAGGTVGQSAVIATFQAYGNSMLKAASLQGLVADPLDKALTVALALTLLAGLPSGYVHRFPFVQKHRVLAVHRLMPRRT